MSRVVKHGVFPYMTPLANAKRLRSGLSSMWEKSLSATTTNPRVYNRLPVCPTKIVYDYIISSVSLALILSGRLKYFNARAAVFIVLVSFQISERFAIRNVYNRSKIICNECMWNLIMSVPRSLILISRRITMLISASKS